MSKSHQDSDSTPLQGCPSNGRDFVVQVDSPHHEPKDYRKLAIWSIICGLSCFGIVALINSVKTRETNKRTPKEKEKAKFYSGRARKYGILAISAWVALIILFPLLMGLLSFLLTFID